MRVVLVALVSLVAVSCSGDGGDGQSATEWATEFCTSTRAWGEEVERIAEGLDRTAPFEELEEAVAEARETTDDYVAALRDLGAPDVDAPEDVEATVEEFTQDVDDEMAEIEDALEDASGVTGAATAVRDIAGSVQAMFTSLERTLETLTSDDVDDDLDQAFEDVEDCANLSR